jgi:hypothetical protein
MIVLIGSPEADYVTLRKLSANEPAAMSLRATEYRTLGFEEQVPYFGRHTTNSIFSNFSLT